MQGKWFLYVCTMCLYQYTVLTKADLKEIVKYIKNWNQTYIKLMPCNYFWKNEKKKKEYMTKCIIWVQLKFWSIQKIQGYFGEYLSKKIKGKECNNQIFFRPHCWYTPPLVNVNNKYYKALHPFICLRWEITGVSYSAKTSSKVLYKKGYTGVFLCLCVIS